MLVQTKGALQRKPQGERNALHAASLFQGATSPAPAGSTGHRMSPPRWPFSFPDRSCAEPPDGREPDSLGRCRMVLYHGTAITPPANARADSPALMPLFAATDLTCLRGERLVFQELSFAVEAGGALVLLGPNGSGKSSLLRMMAGLLRPFSGGMSWDGEPVSSDPDLHRSRVHYVGHLDAVKPVLSARENLAFWASMGGAADPMGAGDGGIGAAGRAAYRRCSGALPFGGAEAAAEPCPHPCGTGAALAARRAFGGARPRRHRPA